MRWLLLLWLVTVLLSACDGIAGLDDPSQPEKPVADDSSPIEHLTTLHARLVSLEDWLSLYF
jgi:uncharacterized protein YceK